MRIINALLCFMVAAYGMPNVEREDGRIVQMNPGEPKGRQRRALCAKWLPCFVCTPGGGRYPGSNPG